MTHVRVYKMNRAFFLPHTVSLVRCLINICLFACIFVSFAPGSTTCFCYDQTIKKKKLHPGTITLKNHAYTYLCLMYCDYVVFIFS